MLGWGYPPNIDGGLDIHVAHLFNELRSRGVEVDLALPVERAPERPGVIPLDVEGDSMMEIAHDLSREIVSLAEDYDIIHTHDWFGSESGLKAKKYADTAWVSTIHSTASGRSHGASNRIEQLERAMAEKSDAFLTVSRKLAEEVEDEYSSRPEVVPNGFSKPESCDKEIKQELGIETMVFYVGRHSQQKGVELLIYGFKKLLSQVDATLVIGGDGHMRSALEDFVELLGMEDNVIFTGFIASEQLGDYYRAADVFVSPSINEPFGLTITEALESGTPVVATENGAQETLPDSAIVQVSRDSDSISEGILEALERETSPEYEARTWSQAAGEVAEIYGRLNP